MRIIEASNDILDQLYHVVNDINEEDFHREVAMLNNSTIGQHVRHTLEFFTCLMYNHKTGVVNYDKRDHDKMIESDKQLAASLIEKLKHFISNNKEDKKLVLEANYSFDNDEYSSIETNYFRELTYNIEHAIHHMAIIKIGLKEVAPYVNIPSHFGIAISTIKYRQNQLSS